MSIDKRPDGKYRARIREYPGGPERSKQFARKLDAERWVAEMRVAIARGSYLTADEMKITFGQYAQTYLSRQIWVDTTRRVACNSLQRAEDHFGPARPLSSIRRGDVQAYVVSLTSQFAPGTVRTNFQHVRTMMRAAHIDGVITVDPTMGITLPKVTSELVILSPDQTCGLLDAADPAFRAAIVLGAHVGLRAGEVQGLFVSDIDFLRRTINVRRQLDGRTSAMTLKAPKSKAGTRSVPVPSVVLDVLAAHVQQFGAGRDGVLMHTDGEYLSNNQLNYQWRRAQVGAGHVKGSLRFHWLRHAFASSLISAGVSVKAVADAMGHENPAVTLRTYASLWPGDDDRIRTALEGVWNIADLLRTKSAQTGS
ncbi:MAG: tyrosine-type recombinase/integrase [Actinobacteria bacterium]|uniref:Unannotated protein n=1 Tax=freshwater metagenome TaxID=449393 RepID=A0A6J6WLZ0_9ZZZZ|nr:tyrosine-type recombinase/integrase [Actinomycetota bacterium]